MMTVFWASFMFWVMYFIPYHRMRCWRLGKEPEHAQRAFVRMVNRKDGQGLVRRGNMRNSAYIHDVHRNISVAQHYALWISGGSGGKKNTARA